MILHNNVFEYDNTDVNFCQCGEEECNNKHFYGPAVRDHYLIHYILEGKGMYKVNGKTYHLKKGQGFLICPNVVTYYQADRNDPWHYIWVGFNGVKAKEYLNKAHLDKCHLTFSYKKDKVLEEYLKEMIKSNHLKVSSEPYLLGYLYLFLGKLIENNNENNITNDNKTEKYNYVKEAIKYIQANYWNNITVQNISEYLCLNRSYLYTLFMEQISMSPQQFIINFRMKKACNLMQTTTLSISEISRSVGYNDPLIFSKAFKKIHGVSPKFYNKSNDNV